MAIHPALLACLMLASLGVFFIGVAFLWWVSLQDRAMKLAHRTGQHPVHSPAS